MLIRCLQMIERALSDTDYINGLSGHVHDIVVRGYVTGLKYTYCKLQWRTNLCLTYLPCVSSSVCSVSFAARVVGGLDSPKASIVKTIPSHERRHWKALDICKKSAKPGLHWIRMNQEPVRLLRGN